MAQLIPYSIGAWVATCSFWLGIVPHTFGQAYRVEIIQSFLKRLHSSMTSTNVKQEAHLRVVIHDAGKFQLVLYADLVGFNLYAGPHGLKNLLRSSWHASGKVHTHTPGGRKLGTPRVMPESFVGKAELYQGMYGGIDWSYRPKRDSACRRTLVVEKIQTERGLHCAIWAVERGRHDLVKEILAEFDNTRGIALISHINADWTQPQLVAIASTLSIASWTALQAATGQT